MFRDETCELCGSKMEKDDAGSKCNNCLCICFFNLREVLISIAVENGVKRDDVCEWLLNRCEVKRSADRMDSGGFSYYVFTNKETVLMIYDSLKKSDDVLKGR